MINMKTIHILVVEIFLFGLCIPAGHLQYVKTVLSPGIGFDQSSSGPTLTLRFASEDCDANSSLQFTNSTGKTALEEVCEIDKNVMEELIGLILSAMDLITGEGISTRAITGTKNNCSLTSKSHYRSIGKTQVLMSPECQALVDNMKDLLNNMITAINELIKWIIENVGEYPEAIVRLQEMVRELNRKICDLKTEHAEELQKLKDKLNDQKDCFILELNNKEKIIEGLKISLDEERLNGIMSMLQAGLVGQASTYFLSMNNDSILEPLITKAYAPQYLENIGKFASLLPKLDQRMVIYNNTYLQMGESEHFLTANIIVLLKVLRDEPNKTSEGFQEMYQNCLGFSTTVISIWGSSIRSRSEKLIQDIIDFGSPPTTAFVGRVFSETLPEILSVAYDNQSNNVDALIDFTKRLRWNAHKFTAVTNLTVAFTKHEDKLRMAFLAKEIISHLDGPDGMSGEWESMYENFYKKSLDSNIRMVVWHTRCTLANTNGQYLSTGSSDTDFFNRHLSATASPQINSWWKIEEFVEDNKYYFRIKSVFNGEYLGAHLSYEEDPFHRHGIPVTSKAYCIDKRFNVWTINYEGAYPHEILLHHEGRQGNLQYTNWIFVGFHINLSATSNERIMYMTLGCE